MAGSPSGATAPAAAPGAVRGAVPLEDDVQAATVLHSAAAASSAAAECLGKDGPVKSMRQGEGGGRPTGLQFETQRRARGACAIGAAGAFGEVVLRVPPHAEILHE